MWYYIANIQPVLTTLASSIPNKSSLQAIAADGGAKANRQSTHTI
jgi:hypothetical protein